MSDSYVVVGRVGVDRRIWIGVEGDEEAYERLEGPLSGKVTHALVIGDDQAVCGLMALLQDELDEEETGE